MKRNQIILGLIISLVIALLAVTPFVLGYGNLKWNNIVLRTAYSFLTSLILWFGCLEFIYNRKLNKNIRSEIAKGVIAIVVLALFTNIVCDYILPKLFEHLRLTDDFPRIKRPGFLFLKCISQGLMYYFIILVQKTSEEKKNSQIELQRLKQAGLEANIISLKEQLSPHFLFNTLNTLSTLTKEKGAQDLIQELSKVYRYVLQYKEKDEATLNEELSFVNSYWYILKARFEDSISLHIDLPDELKQSLIPPLTLQLLIENAVKHNIANEEKPLSIKIYVDSGFIIIENFLQPKRNSSNNSGSGLNNISLRYKLLLNKSIEIKQCEGIFQVKLPIIYKL